MTPKQTHEPGAGKSSADAAFDELRREIAKRNELAQQKARKIRDARDREQVLARRARERL
jgi:hypothetical protein